MTMQKPAPPPSFMNRWGDFVFCGLILLSVVAFFADALFGGKTFLAENDNVAFLSFLPYLEQAKTSGEFPQWVPYIFSGMPSLASFLAAGDRSWDVLSQAVFAIPRFMGELTNNDTWRLALWYTIYGCGIFALMRSKGQERTVSLFSSVAAVFSTWIIVWVMIGHSTKPISFATLPWILLALERLRERFSFGNLFLLILPMVALVSATHPQMMFYIGCATGLYLLVELVQRLVQRQSPVGVLRAAGCLVVAGGLAVATHADMFMATRDYTPYSTRGSAPLVQGDNNTVSASGGNDYEYATNWSFSPEEVITFFVPNYYGFGKQKIDIQGQEQMLMTYWGQAPFTDAANYMGIGVLMLALVGLVVYRRDPFVVFLGILGCFSLWLSFGKNSGPLSLYDVFFHLVPAFDKFRAPSMALCLLQFATPLLAGFGLAAVVRWAPKATPGQKKVGLALLGGGAAFFLLGLVVPGMVEAGYRTDAAAKLTPYYGQGTSMIVDAVYANMRADWTVIGLIAVLFGGVIVLMLRGTLSPKVGIAVLVGLVLIDLWRVDKRPYEPSKVRPELSTFAETDVVQMLKQDKGTFRVADLSRTAPNSWAYHGIEHIHGYSSAKLRVYQDMLDIAGVGQGRAPSPGNSMVVNPFLWDLLNVKYLIADQPLFPNVRPDFVSQQNGSRVYVNRSMLPRAWFVDTVRVEPSGRTILEHLRDGTFDARTTAYVEQALPSAVEPADSTATARLTSRGNQALEFAVDAPRKNFLVVSEVYYPEWHAYVDGTEVPMVKTNYLLRGVVVPAGKHTVTFRFHSPGFETGRTVSMAANGIALLIGALGVFFARRRTKSEGAAV